MKRLLALPLLLLFSLPILAQTHSASVSRTVSTSTAVISQNVYRSSDAGVTFTKLAAGTGLAATATTFTDSTAAAGATYQYYVTAVCPTTGACIGESIPSNKVTAVIPGNPPPPPTGLTITSVAINNVNGQDRLQVNWTAPTNDSTAFTIFGGNGQVLKQGSQTTSNGVYSYAILIPVQNGTVSICDARGCTSQNFQGI